MEKEPNLTGRTSIQMPPDMKAMLEQKAFENNRSLSSEVVHRLRREMKLPPLKKKPAVTRNRKEVVQAKKK